MRPHVLELGHFGTVAPGGVWEDEVRQEDADENHIVDHLVESFVRGRDELGDPLLSDCGFQEVIYQLHCGGGFFLPYPTQRQ